MSDYFVMLWGLLKGGLVALTLLTALDFIFGVIVSLLKKDFKWSYLGHYLTSDVLPIFVWVGVVLISTIPAEFIPEGVIIVAKSIVYGTVFLMILGSLLESFAYFGVLKLPLEKIGVRNDPWVR
ncbi:MAG: hypothetical protein A2Y53_04955 [Chloroflexi bacterium RBG_16_47_49]|nr:MAG: hypothetical protein A2Y53_04955 [Chloroflexi bacterium RBG_16_47_49]